MTDPSKAGADADRTQDERLVSFARRLLAVRKQRDHGFDPLIFSNPPWEMLLDLYVAGDSGRPVLDTTLAACVPQSVALRWLTYLEKEKMVVETPDHMRGPQTLLRLSDAARDGVRRYLALLVSPTPPTPSPSHDVPPPTD